MKVRKILLPLQMLKQAGHIFVTFGKSGY